MQTADTNILIDAGFSGRKLKSLLEAANLTPEQIDAVFITHEHGDHTCGLKGLSRYEHLTYYTSEGTYEALRHKYPQLRRWKLFQSGQRFAYRDMEVQSFYVPHDAMDPVGFVFQCGETDNRYTPLRSLAWLTDLGHIPLNIHERVANTDVLVLEANHDETLLEQDARRPWSLKQRIRSKHGHLSNGAAGDFLRTMAEARWQHVYLAHLSKDCNTVELAQAAAATGCAQQRTVHVVDPVSGCVPTLDLLATV